MGQQQLMIIVLLIFVVGLAVWTGVRVFRSMNMDNERDVVLHQMTMILGEARKYASKPKSIGGGEGTFTGFSPITQMTSTQRVTVNVSVGADWLLMQGFGSVEGWDGVSPVQVVAQYDMSSERFSTISRVN